VLKQQQAGNRPALLPQSRDAIADSQRPVDQPPPRAVLLVELGEDGRVDLLVDARDAWKQGRAYARQLLRGAERIGQERDREAGVRRRQMQEPAVVVREREVQQHQVSRLDETAFHLVALLHHRVVVAVPDHAGFRRPCRPGGVDEREEVVFVDRVRPPVELAGMFSRVGAASLAQRVEIGEHQHVLDAATGHLCLLLRILDENPDRFRVREHVAGVARRAVRIDRGADGADETQREVEQRPFEARARQDAERLPLAHTECEQAVRQLVDGPGGLSPRHLDPFAVHLPQIGGVGSCGRVPPQIRDRPGRGHFRPI